MTILTNEFSTAKFYNESGVKTPLRMRARAFTAPLPEIRSLPPAKAGAPAPDGQGYPALTALFEAASFQQHFRPNSTILLHGDPADAVYQIVSGTVRCCMISAQGCRQIPSFRRKGSFLGIADQTTWHFTAEAVDHIIINSVSRTVIEREFRRSSALQQEMRTYILTLLECREKQLLTLVSTKACDRVFEFLCEFTASKPKAGYTALPMCRRDIADHLGLSVETVSRAFSDLKRKGRIDLATSEKYRITTLAG